MRYLISPSLLLSICTGLCSSEALADHWPSFRGPNGGGWARGIEPLPTRIGPERHVLWKIAIPAGHSSPVVNGERIFLTAADGETLLTIALARETGKELWRREAPRRELERIHRIGSYAQATCSTDGERVVSFFGSSGLICYSLAGRELWYRPLGPFKNGFGAASSPVISGDRVVLNQDHDTDSFLMALDKRTGELVWKTDRSQFPRGFSTPVIREHGDRKEIVVAGTLRLMGYDLASGEPRWTVHGTSRIVNTTPVVAPDGTLYVACWSPGADAGDRIQADPFDQVLAAHDRNGNEVIDVDEVPEGDLGRRADQIDRDKDGTITRFEYDYMKHVFETAQNVVMAIAPGEGGDISDSDVKWRQSRYLPYVPSPLYHAGHLYLVKNGGIVSTLDVETGEYVKVGRISGRGNYYSSPVGGDGKIYLLSERGELSVIRARGEWEEIHHAKFGEDAYATPAIVGGRIYLRTSGHLFCFAAAE